MNYNRLVTLNYTTELKPATLYSSYLTAYTLHMALLHNPVHWVAHVGTFFKNDSKLYQRVKLKI